MDLKEGDIPQKLVLKIFMLVQIKKKKYHGQYSIVSVTKRNKLKLIIVYTNTEDYSKMII